MQCTKGNIKDKDNNSIKDNKYKNCIKSDKIY